MKDLETIKTWFNEHPSFTNVPGLMSIANGLTATNESKVNCDSAEEVGAKIQPTLDGVKFTVAKVKRSEKVKSLAHVQESLKIDGDEVPIDPMTLFNRLVVLVMRETDMVPYVSSVLIT